MNLPKNKCRQWLAALIMSTASFAATAAEVTQQHNGIRLNANLELADGKDFADGMVLIMHGMMGHNRMELVEASQQLLLENDLSSLAINISLDIDNRHGFFDCAWPQRHEQQDAIVELALWVNWLRNKGATQVALMAHSRGSNQAMIYAAEQIDPEITHLILLAPGADDVKKSYQERYGPIFDATVARMNERIALGKGEEMVSNIDFWFCPKADVTPNSYISYYGEDSKFRQFYKYLPAISIPTLVVTGTQDERFPNISKQVSPYVDNQRLFLVEIENAGHFFRDLNIDEAIEALIEFIAHES